jgi:DNA-binding NarL/FixJ family response regulator
MLKLFAKYLPSVDLITASNGSEGLLPLSTGKPQVVLTDLLMPGSNGQELIKQIRAGDANTKIIVISADVQKAIRQEVEQWGSWLFSTTP